MITSTLNAAGRLRRGLARRRQIARESRLLRRVDAILSSPEPPRPYDSEELFRRLQSEYGPRGAYRYDAFSNWQRGVQRAGALMVQADLKSPGGRVLEAACGDGMTGAALAGFGHEVVLHDLEDWRDERARGLPFVAADLADRLPLEPDGFDLIFCYNAFEHISDPGAALTELVRVCRPGGRIVIEFGPLHASAWGLHAYRTVRFPYPQFLFSEAFLSEKFRSMGLWDLGKPMDALQPLNGWRVSQFDRLWAESGCVVVKNRRTIRPDHLGLVETYPLAFSGRGLTRDDLVVHALAVVLQKPGGIPGPTPEAERPESEGIEVARR